MAKRYKIEFVESVSPITGLVTKFGGQPDWVGEAQWPLSRETGNPMRFLCEIKLSPELFPNAKGQMAYLFMTDEEDGDFVDGTYEPDGGENAVILQPGHTGVPTAARPQGPTLYRMVQRAGAKLLTPEPCQFGVRLIEEDDAEANAEDFSGVRIGGKPVFLQGEEFPFEGTNRLLIQIDSCSVPFYVNFGDAGVGYAFLNEAGDQAKLLWQCC
jgi:uncharacterized protein YwqG